MCHVSNKTISTLTPYFTLLFDQRILHWGISSDLSPTPKVIQTPNLVCGLVLTKIVQKNWFWVVDVTIVTPQPYIKKTLFFDDVTGGPNFVHRFAFWCWIIFMKCRSQASYVSKTFKTSFKLSIGQKMLRLEVICNEFWLKVKKLVWNKNLSCWRDLSPKNRRGWQKCPLCKIGLSSSPLPP